MGEIAIGTAATLAVYMVLLLSVGIWASKRAGQSEEDFVLGGRTLGPIVSGLAYAASTSSAWVLLGYTGFVAAVGISALWMVPGILFGYGCVWLWIGPWLNSVSREKGYLTILDLITSGAEGKMLILTKAVAAILIVICFAFYIAVQFQGAGSALGDVFALDTKAAIVLGALVIVIYTFMGGFWAVSLTDTLQGLSIALIALILPVAAVIDGGGFSNIWSSIEGQASYLSEPFGTHASWSIVGFLFGLSALGIGAMGQPHLLTWVMAVRDRKARIQGAAVAISWGALVFGGMSVIALAARASAAPDAVLGETIVFDLAQDTLPGVLPALVYAAILSAVMSTVDSQLLVASAVASHDMGLSKLAPGREVLITRLVIVALCLGAVFLALFIPASIFERAVFAWTALGAAFGPTIVGKAMGREPSPMLVLVAMLTGFALTVVFNQVYNSGPGAWLERGLPWIVGLSLIFGLTRKQVSTSQ